MREFYIAPHESDAGYFICPFKLTTTSSSKGCEGSKCMAWIESLDNRGNPTKVGRCGMISGTLGYKVTSSTKVREEWK